MSGYMNIQEAEQRLSSEKNLANLLDRLRKHDEVNERPGVSGEANPDPVTSEHRNPATSLPPFRVEESDREGLDSSVVPATTIPVLAPDVVFKPMHNGGRPAGVKNMSPEAHQVIGVMSALLGPTATGDIMGLSPSHASNIEHGRVDATHVKQELVTRIEEKTGKIKSDVLDKLLEFVPDVTATSRDRADVVSKLAGVVDKLTPKNPNQAQNVQVIVYTPKTRDESSYEMVEIGPKSQQ